MEPRIGYLFSNMKVHSSSVESNDNLTVNQPRDKFENEADLMADKIIGTDRRDSINEVMNFNSHSLSSVRIHTGSLASNSARSIGSRAYTAGNNIVFGSGQYRPKTFEGMRLLAHELVHVAQQGCTGTIGIQRDAPGEIASDIPDDFETFKSHLSAQNNRIGDAIDLLKKQKDSKLIIEWLSKLSNEELIRLNSPGEPRINAFIEIVYYSRFEPTIDSIKKILDSIAAFPASELAEIDNYLKGKADSIGAIRIYRLKNAPPQFWSNRSTFLQKAGKEFNYSEIQEIEHGLYEVAGENMPLWTEYYSIYSSASLLKAVGQKEAHMKGLGRAGDTKGSDTWIRPDYLNCSHTWKEVGAILVHEFVHLRHTGGFAGGEASEGEAYGVDYFLAERFGDTRRASSVYSTIASNPQGDIDSLQKEFKRSYGIMKILYEIIDGKTSSAPQSCASPKPFTPEEARKQVVNFLKDGVSFTSDQRLKCIVQWVENNRKGFIPRQDWPITDAWKEQRFVNCS
jgi:hypothetical protein